MSYKLILILKLYRTAQRPGGDGFAHRLHVPTHEPRTGVCSPGDAFRTAPPKATSQTMKPIHDVHRLRKRLVYQAPQPGAPLPRTTTCVARSKPCSTARTDQRHRGPSVKPHPAGCWSPVHRRSPFSPVLIARALLCSPCPPCLPVLACVLPSGHGRAAGGQRPEGSAIEKRSIDEQFAPGWRGSGCGAVCWWAACS